MRQRNPKIGKRAKREEEIIQILSALFFLLRDTPIPPPPPLRGRIEEGVAYKNFVIY